MTSPQPDSPLPNQQTPADSPTIGETPPTSCNVGKRNSRDALYAALTAAAYLMFLEIVARIPTDNLQAILATTLASLLFTLFFTVYMARGLRSILAISVVGLVSLLLIAPSVAIPVLIRMHPEWQGWPGVVPHYKAYRLALNWLPGVDGLLMVACAVSIGVLISRVVKEYKMLLPIAVVLAVVDMYVVFGGGLVTQAVSGNDVPAKLMSSLTVKLPTVHPARGAMPMQLEMGFADYLFIGLFFACFAKFEAPSRQTFMVLCCVLAGVMLFVGVLQVALPALVPIAIVVLGMNIRRFQFARDELFAMLYAGIIVAVIIAALVLKSRVTRQEPQKGTLKIPETRVGMLLRFDNGKLGLARLKHSQEVRPAKAAA